MNERIRTASSILVLAAAAVLAPACTEHDVVVNPPSFTPPANIVGNGNVVEQTRTVGSFDRITVTGVGNLEIRQGAREELRVRAEENLLEHVKTDVNAGELLIWVPGGTSLRTTQPIEYHITVTDLRRVTVTGVGQVRASSLDVGSLALMRTGVGSFRFDDLRASQLTVDAGGVGEFRLSGSVQTQTVTLRGIHDYLAGNLLSHEADVRVSDRGSATLRVRDRLDATITGSGSIYYYGDPTVTSVITGSGRLECLGPW